MQAEAQILLGRLEQAWDAAVARGSASLMLRVIKLQAELSGLDRRTAGRRADLWPLPKEEARSGRGPAARRKRPRRRSECRPARSPWRSGTAATGPGGRWPSTGRNRKALERRADFDPDRHLADHLATACALHNAVEERRRLAPGTGSGSPAMTDHDISIHAADRTMERNNAIDRDRTPGRTAHRTDLHHTDLHPIDLHRAGLLPPEPARKPAGNGAADGNGGRRTYLAPAPTASPLDPAWVDETVEAARRAGLEGDDLARVGREAFRQYSGKCYAVERPR